MKKRLSILLAALPALLFCSCNQQGGGVSSDVKLSTAVDTLSWAYGQNLAEAMSQGALGELDKDRVLQAVRHTLDGKPQPLSQEQTGQAINYLMFLHNAVQMDRSKQMEENMQALQNEYFAELKRTNPNVKEHPSGFFYEVLREGNGPKARLAQRIKFDYRSKLMLSGQDYDQSYGQRDSIIHVVGNPMFPGLIEGFQLMNAGSLYRFYFPYQLAFGERGSGEIPGYTPFIYEVELHEIYKN